MITLYTRTFEYLYSAGLLSDSIELYDDDDLVNGVAFIRFTLPANSRNSYFASISNAVTSYFYGEDVYSGVRGLSANQPYIDIEPASAKKPLVVGVYDSNPYLRNLLTLAETMSEGATLRVFPGTDPTTGELNYKVVLLYLGENGSLTSQSPVVEIKKNWGTSAEGLWLTDKMARNTLFKQTYNPYLYDYLWGTDEHLSVYNPVDADMIAELALVVDLIRQKGFMLPPAISGSHSAPQPVVIKQSGFNLAAVDAGGVVYYVDKFLSQDYESPTMTVKVTSIDEIDESRLVSLEEKRLNRFEKALRGQKPFDPARDRMEMAILKLFLNNIFTSYADAGARAAMGMDKVRYPDPLFADIEQTLFLRQVWRNWAEAAANAALPAEPLIPLMPGI